MSLQLRQLEVYKLCHAKCLSHPHPSFGCALKGLFVAGKPEELHHALLCSKHRGRMESLHVQPAGAPKRRHHLTGDLSCVQVCQPLPTTHAAAGG